MQSYNSFLALLRLFCEASLGVDPKVLFIHLLQRTDLAMVALGSKSDLLELGNYMDSLEVHESDDQLIIGLDFGTTFR